MSEQNSSTLINDMLLIDGFKSHKGKFNNRHKIFSYFKTSCYYTPKILNVISIKRYKRYNKGWLLKIFLTVDCRSHPFRIHLCHSLGPGPGIRPDLVHHHVEKTCCSGNPYSGFHVGCRNFCYMVCSAQIVEIVAVVSTKM